MNQLTLNDYRCRLYAAGMKSASACFEDAMDNWQDQANQLRRESIQDRGGYDATWWLILEAEFYKGLLYQWMPHLNDLPEGEK